MIERKPLDETSRQFLEDLAGRVADGQTVEWDDEKTHHSAVFAQIEELETLARLSRAHLEIDRWGPLEVLGEIGGGGFARVLRARDPQLDREVALKVSRRTLSEDEIQAFVREARRMAKVRHPNILMVHGVAEHDGQVGLWSELVQGETLREILDRQGRFSVEEAVRIGLDLCAALAAVHAEGLVHRDVKLANVMREEGGRTVLMDFGSVAELEGIAEDPPSGTPCYMAPELFYGAEPTVSVDVYSLGVALFRMVTGEYPIKGNLSQIQEAHSRGERRSLRDLRPDAPAGFVEAIEKAIAVKPEDRFVGMAEFERALRQVAVSQPRRATAASPLIPVLAVAAALLLVLIVIFSVPDRYVSHADLFARTATGDEIRLHPGRTVRPGDRVFTEVQISHDSYIYAMNEDSQGNVVALFPDSRFKIQNPVPGGRWRLPGELKDTDKEVSWGIDDVGVSECFIVVISREPLPAVEEMFQTVARAEEATEVARASVGLRTALVESLRGAGQLLPLEDGSRREPGILADIARKLEEEETGAIRVMRFEFPKQ